MKKIISYLKWPYSLRIIHFITYIFYKLFYKNIYHKVSVIIPFYNNSATIIKCLNSLINQSHKNLELILIDDYSLDDTVHKVIEFQKKHVYDIDIKLYRSREKIGTAKARNIGLNVATGDYVTFQDADDISHHHRILFQLKSLLIYPRKKLSLCLYNRFYQDKIIKINRKKFNKCIISMMFPRQEILSLFGGMLPIKIGEDSEFRERIISFFGKNTEIIVKIPLYKALFSINSSFFSECENINYHNDNVSYDHHKIKKNQYLDYYRLWHEKIEKEKFQPHFSKAPPLLEII